jgi:hypothetical protein
MLFDGALNFIGRIFPADEADESLDECRCALT